MAIRTRSFTEWQVDSSDLLLVAGPCSAESRQQVLDTARALVPLAPSLFRAGIWKPRTRPGSFEGVGAQGVRWLADVKKETGLAVATEVATPEHVELCLKAGIDALWVGARTTVSPFSVQAIAESLRGVDIPVMVKNPASPDLDLWLGALERFSRAGIKRLMAIHRGFTAPRKGKLRNPPQWRIPIEVKMRMPQVPMICDPSHLAGDAALVGAVSQEAMDLLFDGLMIEVHLDPITALSDPAQQITPAALGDLLSKLTRPDPRAGDRRLTSWRLEIDEIDSRLVELFGHRMEIVRKMGEYKDQEGISTFQPSRWSEIVKSRVEAGVAAGLSADFVEQVYEMVHEEAIRQQERIRLKAEL